MTMPNTDPMDQQANGGVTDEVQQPQEEQPVVVEAIMAEPIMAEPIIPIAPPLTVRLEDARNAVDAALAGLNLSDSEMASAVDAENTAKTRLEQTRMLKESTAKASRVARDAAKNHVDNAISVLEELKLTLE